MADEEVKDEVVQRIKTLSYDDVLRSEPTFKAFYELALADLKLRTKSIQNAMRCSEGVAMVIVFEAICEFLKERGIPEPENRDQYRSRNTAGQKEKEDE